MVCAILLRKPISRILIICTTMVALCGCSLQPNSYPFEKRFDPIKSVELLYYPWAIDSTGNYMEFESIRFLETAEISDFMKALYEIPTKRARPTPNSDFGPYIARVTYVDGDVEYFGSRHIEYVAYGEKIYAIGYYYFLGDAFEELFFRYAGDKLPTNDK